MKYYVQYNPETGAISALVSSENAPAFESQLEFEECPDIINKKVNLETLELVDEELLEEP